MAKIKLYRPIAATAIAIALGASAALSPMLAAPARAEPAGKAAASQASSPTTRESLAAIASLLAEMHKSTTTPDRWRDVVEQLLALEPDGPRRLAEQCARDYPPAYRAYVANLESAADAALRAGWKGKGDIEQEVLASRKTVNDLTRSANLTKEMIHNDADPAMHKLDALLTIAPEAVLASQAQLKAQRQMLFDLAKAWRLALEQAPPAARKAGDVATAPPDAAALEEDLAAKLKLASEMATPMNAADRQTLIANFPLAARLDPQEADGIFILNMMRVRLGIGALAIDPRLCLACKGHSTDMRNLKFFAHESPVPGKETPWKRAALAGTSADAENIFEGSAKGADAINAWWYSPGHHKNMLGAHHRTGLGRCDNLWTQEFGG